VGVGGGVDGVGWEVWGWFDVVGAGRGVFGEGGGGGWVWGWVGAGGG
jgi:hypothetical protein